MSAKSNIVDAYPLSPLQEGMLFHSLYEPEGGAYVTQLAWTFLGPLDAGALESAWQRVVDRHPVLRTAFAWKNLEKPIQVVGRAVRLALAQEDWSSLDPGERERRWEDLLEGDRKRGFDLARAPLLRLVLIREGDGVHRFLWTHHHILLDGWSLNRVLGEVFSLYEARRRNRELELPPCPPFRRYIEWLSRQDLARAEAFWRAELAGFTAPTPLPSGGERPAANGAAGPEVERTLRLPESTVEALRARARSSQLTLNTMTQAAWALLLGRISGDDDVVFGVTVSGRPPALPGVEDIVGMFINTLPLRVDVRPDQPLLAWLRGLQERQLEMRQHEHSPLLRIHGWSEVPRGLSLFHSFLVFENFPADRGMRQEGGDSGLEVRDVRAFERANYPLGVVVNSHLALRLSYDAARFDATAITRLLGHLVLLLEGLAAGAAERIADLPFLSEAERHQIATEWNDSLAIPPPAELGGAAATIHGLCEAWARLTPDAPAVICGGEALTYRQLDRRANHLAHLLRDCGVGPEVRVGLCLRRTPELLAGLLAILKAGGAYLPLDISYPAERLAYLLDDAQVFVLLSEEALVGQLPLGGPRLEILVDGPGGCGERDAPPDGGAAPESLAYLIYTSGSTGRPKGVMVHHRGAVNTGMSLSHLFDLRSDSRVLQFSSSSFDASVSEILEALRSGAALCLADGEALLPGPGLLGALRGPGVTHVTLPPSVLSLLPEQELPELRSLIVAGEACPAELPVRWGRGRRFFNAYGPTEASVCATVKECAADGRPPALGRPIPGARVHLLDRHLRRTPIGVVGELYIGGAGVARGYSDRPALTAERFVPDPFGSLHGEPGTRLYRTGDLARYLPDGEIAYLGRIDHQVKVRGFRIEPGEIETVLAQCPGVREALVVVRDGGGDGPGDLRLVAYVAGEASSDDLRRFVQERLPEHMVPSAFVTLDAFPLTSNGKIDRAALPAPDQPVATREMAAPRSEGEQLLAGIWSEVLGVERVGRGDNFFDLGGHSLLATQVASRVRAVFGVELAVQAIFEQPVLSALAAHVEEAMRAVDGAGAPPLAPVPRDLPVPLSFAQQRLWFLDCLVPDSPVYNLPLQAHLSGPLRLAALAGALAEIVRRHEALRTRFEETSTGEPVQRIDPPRRLVPPLVDLADLPSGVREEEARRIAREEAVLPFDLARGPLLRASLLRLEGEEHTALLTTHHIVSDGWSLGLLTAELSALYAAACQGRPSPLPALPIQYADYAAWQRSWLAGEVLARQIAVWKKRLEGAPPVLALPTDRPRAAVQRYRGALRRLSLSGSLAGALRELCRRERVSTFMALLAVFQTLLSRSSGQEDVSVGTPIAGRNRLETEKLIGFFVNTLVLRTDLAGSPTFRELLGRVRKVSLEAHAHQDLPFEKLVEELQPDRSLSHAPLFQVMLTLQNAPQEEHELPGLTLRALGQDTGTAKFDLTLSVAELGERLQAVLDYDVDLFDAASIDRMLARFETLLRGALDDPGTQVTELPLLAEEERLQILVEWNQTAAEPPAEACLHEAFEAQAARCPEATALVAEEERLAYGELDRRANRLARHLRDLGVGPEVPVGVCLKRTPDLLIALLAILKAGGAYVPLDPESPPRRLAAILEDANRGIPVPRVVTSGALVERLPALDGLRLIRLDWEAQAIALQSSACLERWATGDNLAYLIYTSGSTGVPKGVAIAHRSAVEMVAWARRAFAPRELAAVLASTSINFDLSVFELFTPLSAGGRVVLARDALHLVDLPARGEVTLVNTVPSALAELLRLGPLPAAVRTVCLAGEPLPAELARALHRQAGVERVLNLYGPSEDTTYSTWAEIPPGFEGAPPIGIPVSNTRAYLLDPGGLPVPVGVAGELHLGGAGLARGYFRQPVWTSERFVPDPFAGPGGRLYRTGDLARWRPDGQLDFLGRIDHQVKLRGFRIELREIEAALAAHAEVREAVVVVREDRPGDRRLTGYVVPADGTESWEQHEPAVREHLRATLPGYMIPAALVALDALPLTPNGKVDRKALPAPAPAAGTAGESGRPRTPVEELMAGIWCEVLGLPAVGVHDNFFALGGHSLLATRIVARVRAAFQVELPLRSLFETPTVAGLAASLANGGRGTAPAPPIARAPRAGDPPLSSAQRRLWFLDQLERGSARYNMTQGVRLLGELDVTALGWALDEVVRRHEVLRTAYPEVGESPVQRVAPAVGVPLPRLDLGGLPAVLRETEMGRVVARWERLPFDLMRGPVLRLCLIRLEPREHALLLAIHHVAADAWSIRLLVHELTVLYAAFVRGEPSPLPELPIQYGDYALWERSWLQSEVLKEQLAWWRRRLAGSVPELDLPTDRPRPEVPSGRGGLLLVPLPDELAARLRALSRQEGATLFITLLAAYAALLYRSTGQEDLVIGADLANRTQPETEDLIGLFLNMLALRMDLSGNPTFRALLRRGREVVLGALSHQDLPFDRLVEELQPQRGAGHSPLFRVVFSFNSDPRLETADRVEGMPGITARPLATEYDRVRFDLVLRVNEAGERLTAAWGYSADLFQEETVARMHRRLAALLASLVERPDARLDDLEILGTEEKAAEKAREQLARDKLKQIRGRRSIQP